MPLSLAELSGMIHKLWPDCHPDKKTVRQCDCRSEFAKRLQLLFGQSLTRSNPEQVGHLVNSCGNISLHFLLRRSDSWFSIWTSGTFLSLWMIGNLVVGYGSCRQSTKGSSSHSASSLSARAAMSHSSQDPESGRVHLVNAPPPCNSEHFGLIIRM